jgi:hypothetical protein
MASKLSTKSGNCSMYCRDKAGTFLLKLGITKSLYPFAKAVLFTETMMLLVQPARDPDATYALIYVPPPSPHPSSILVWNKFIPRPINCLFAKCSALSAMVGPP